MSHLSPCYSHSDCIVPVTCLKLHLLFLTAQEIWCSGIIVCLEKQKNICLEHLWTLRLAVWLKPKVLALVNRCTYYRGCHCIEMSPKNTNHCQHFTLCCLPRVPRLKWRFIAPGSCLRAVLSIRWYSTNSIFMTRFTRFFLFYWDL